MAGKRPPSRSRFRAYRRELKSRPLNQRRRSRTFLQLFRAFWGLLGPHRPVMILALGTLTVSTLVALVPLYAPKIVFDSILGDQPIGTGLPSWMPLPGSRRTLLGTVAAAMVALTAVSIALSMWGRWHATRITKRVQIDARKRTFEHAVRLPLHRIYALRSGGAASLLREDAGGIAELVFSLIYNPWRAIIQLLGSLAILAWTDWRLLLGSLALLPLVYVTHRTWISRIRPLFRDIRASRQRIDAHATETFGGIRVVRSFGRQRSETAHFTGDNDYMVRQEIHAWWWMRGVDIAWSILIPAASALLLWYGGTRILTDRELVAAGLLAPEQALTVGDLVMFMSYLIALLSPLETLANSATTFQNNLAALDRVLDLLAEPAEMRASPGAAHVRREQVAGRITLRGVTFRYPGTGRDVLEAIDLDVQPGQCVAFVGPSGAGKTTLCNLIARFYDPVEGHIELDGRDLRDIDVDSYRRLLGIVEQDTFLFDGTIAENIGYGRRDATHEEIVEAARLANADEFIRELADGYGTVIGERGVKLSGGQRQRITIARAILADPKILILDEATSNLDTQSERLIQASLQTLMAGRTSFVIAHRLSTITHADAIVVLEDGRIIEQGRHEELMARSTRYREMVELQTQPTAPGSPPVAHESAHHTFQNL